MWIILSLTTAFGGAIELLQPLVKRNCGMADFLANAGGAVGGVLVARYLGLTTDNSRLTSTFASG